MILETTRGTLNLAAKPHNPWRQYEGIATDTHAGVRVAPEDSLALVAVYGAVSLIADANGTMPLETIDQRAISGRKVVEGGWMAPMLRYEPNSDMSGADLWTMVNAHLILRGNAYLAKLKNPDGTVRELYPLMPWNVNPYRDAQGRKVFRVTVYEGDTAVDADYTPDAILHIKGKSITNPLRGESPFTHARDVIGTQLAQTEYQARAYQDGMMLKGILSVPHMNFSPDAAERVKQQWRSAYAGLGNSHDIAVLHGGASFNPVSLSPEDAQFIQTMKWTHTQIATLLKIPASRLNGEGTSMTYANQGQDDLFFDKQACLPLRIMIEQAINRDRDLFGPSSPWVPKFNPKTQLQADILTRFEVYETARRIGVMSQNDILRAEDRPEIGPAGDDYTPLATSKATPEGAPDAAA